ncbi:MAG: energy-coupling factor ABC transporter ATP-binding protein [Desulfobulbaceae bacterium]|nr:energy-coupling factor ABC transporter ATP-binding protein [Desulfobulbaceae bacterium]
MASNDLILSLRGISYSYSRSRPVLDRLDLDLRAGEKVGLVGDNGSGKTTLLHLIVGLKKAAAGTLTVFGREACSEEDFRLVRQGVGLLFQDADDQLFCPTVLEDVAFGPINQGHSPAEARLIAGKVLADLGLGGFEERITHHLSGGEKRLVALATVLAMSPRLLLLDEPTTGLDHDTKERLLAILRRLDIAYMVVSHDYDFLGRVADSVFYMKDGRILTTEEGAIHSHFHIHSFGTLPHQHSS